MRRVRPLLGLFIPIAAACSGDDAATTDDSATTADLGVTWRPTIDTFRDAVDFLRRVGALEEVTP